MIFALATDDRSLHGFADAGRAVAYCEGIDVEDGVWEFWGSGGEALQPVFSVPDSRNGSWVLSGVYSLQQSPGWPSLLEALSQTGHLESGQSFPSFAAAVNHLAQSGKLQVHAA